MLKKSVTFVLVVLLLVPIIYALFDDELKIKLSPNTLNPDQVLTININPSSQGVYSVIYVVDFNKKIVDSINLNCNKGICYDKKIVDYPIPSNFKGSYSINVFDYSDLNYKETNFNVQETINVVEPNNNFDNRQTDTSTNKEAFFIALPSKKELFIRKSFKESSILSEKIADDITSVLADVDVKLEHDLSYARIIVEDSRGNEFLVFASDSIVLRKGEHKISDICEETCEMIFSMPIKIKVDIYDAELYIDKISYGHVQKTREEIDNSRRIRKEKQVQKKINLLNDMIKEKGYHWTAGDTSIVRLPYQEKKKLFRDNKLPNLYGFDAYKGGVFELPSNSESGVGSSSGGEEGYPGSQQTFKVFDFRNRHGQNWITPVKNQGSCGSCWDFSAVAEAEARIGLYYNQYFNVDLSEQDVLSCSGAGNCGGGWPDQASDYIEDYGVVDEPCFPYEVVNVTCSDKCSDWADRKWYVSRNYLNTKVDWFKLLRESGPQANILTEFQHAITNVGYEELLFSHGYVSIFKNSWGSGWGENGYGKMYRGGYAQNMPLINVSVTQPSFKSYSVECVDNDIDNYCVWGLWKKPLDCPVGCHEKQDYDDSNPSITLIDYCRDGIDDDEDGLIDCADTLDCPEGAPCSPDNFCNSQGLCGVGEGCTNNVDDDNDGLIDCEDVLNCPALSYCDPPHIKQCTYNATCMFPLLNLKWEYYNSSLKRDYNSRVNFIAAPQNENGDFYFTGKSNGLNYNLFINKFDGLSKLLWDSTSKFKMGNSSGRGVTTNDFNIYVIGNVANTSYKSMSLMKFDNSGKELWNKTFLNEEGYSIASATDNSALYVAGSKFWKFDVDGNMMWEKPKEAWDYRDVAVSSPNEIYVTDGIYLYKYDSSGVKQWKKFLRAGEFGEIQRITVSSDGNIYTVGNWDTYSKPSKFYLAKYLPDGTQLWNITDDTTRVGYDVAISPDNKIYTTALSYVYDYRITPSVILMLNDSGNFTWKLYNYGKAVKLEDDNELINIVNTNNGLIAGGTTEENCVSFSSTCKKYLWLAKYVNYMLEVCHGPYDDDNDGLINCEDIEDCSEGAICGYNLYCNPLQECKLPEICDVVGDEDEDGNADCIDSGCIGKIGPDGGLCETVEVTCTDGYDNDGDFDIDCFDSNCEGTSDCIIPYQQGWPRNLDKDGTPPIIISDVDRTSSNEVIIGAKERIYLLNYDASDYNINWPIQLPQYSNVYSIATGDVNNDGMQEIAALIGSNVKLYNLDGTIFNGFDKVIGDNIMADSSNLVLADVTGDGNLEIIVSVTLMDDSLHDSLYIWDYNGNLIDSSWPLEACDRCLKYSPAIGDIDGDKVADIVIPIREYLGYGNFNVNVNILKWTGDSINSNWPVRLENKDIMSLPIITDVDNDKNLDIVLVTSNGIDILNKNAQSVFGWPQVINGFSPKGYAVGNINNDSNIEIVVGNQSEILIYNFNGTRYATDHLLKIINGSLTTTPIIADVSGDDNPEIIIIGYSSNGYYLYAWNNKGRPANGFPIFVINAPGLYTQAAADLDNDGDIELIYYSRQDQLIARDIQQNITKSQEWPQYQHDAQHTGSTNQPINLSLNPNPTDPSTLITATIKGTFGSGYTKANVCDYNGCNRDGSCIGSIASINCANIPITQRDINNNLYCSFTSSSAGEYVYWACIDSNNDYSVLKVKSWYPPPQKPTPVPKPGGGKNIKPKY